MATSMVKARLEDPSAMRFEVSTNSNHRLVLDALPAVGGEDSGPRPGEMPLVGLAGCTGMDVISVLRKMRQEVKSLTVEVEGLRKNEDHPRRWLELRVVFHVEGKVAPDKLERAIDLSRTRYCVVGAMMRPKTLIHYRYVLNGEPHDMPDQQEE